MTKKLYFAIAVAVSMTACSAPRNESVDSAGAGAAAGQMSGADSLRAGIIDSNSRGDSASRILNDTARVGRDTGRQSQAPTPNKQP